MTVTDKPNLTLYGIETQLLELLNFRDSVESDPDMTPQEQAESLKACDYSIAEYIRAEVKKCDGIASYLREFETRAAAEAEEIERLKLRKQMWERYHDNLEAMVIDILRAVPGHRIDGRHSILKLAKNPPSVEVAQPSLVPENMQRISVTMPLDFWLKMRALSPDYPLTFASLKEGNPEPMKTEIAKRLKEGDGVPGCRLRTDSVRLEVK